ncbi:DUF4253 domain-containing protein [Acrocarpospora catenulata]|uniref:DUF4253 domain-containing protein n=1 Tax=Acrocarpospora catenulata TaxID=2836182 RepID=UPI0027DF3C11|nr:DUF4253 domain-containing protein [Acrocarpospora catenulata]
MPLPEGLLVSADPSLRNDDVVIESDAPALWMSRRPIEGEVWAAFRAEQPRSGLWPLILLQDEDGRPWEDGELVPVPVTEIDKYDASAFMAQAWAYWAEDGDGDGDLEGLRLEDLEPFRGDCPGLAPFGESGADPDDSADRCAKLFDEHHGHLGLVAADRGADALAVMGWTGPINHGETPPLSAMLRSWETRFGARVVAVGFDTLHVSVAAPPTTLDHALQVAAEHFAFCPDNILQGDSPYTLRAYAQQLVGRDVWGFWWD